MQILKMQTLMYDFEKQLEHCRKEVIPTFKEM